MNQQPPSFVTVDSENYICPGCSFSNDDVFSDLDSGDEELPHQLLDRFLDKSRSATVNCEEISARPFYHGRIETPIVAFNVAALQLSHDLLDKVEHIPKTIVFTEKCTPEDFYKTVGCTRESKEVLTNIIVFKFTPEDIEDESLTDNLYKNLVESKSFASAKLKCNLFSKLYAVPLPQENEPPAFLPITSRVNLETCPRDDNVLLGVLVKKPPLEEGELSGESNQPPVDVDSSNLSENLSPVSPDFTDAPPSSSKPASLSPNSKLSPSTLAKIKSGLDSTFKLMPSDRYGSYIGAPTEDIPFLTDPVTTLHSVPSATSRNLSRNTAVSTIPRTDLLDDISDNSDIETPSESVNQLSSSRKRTLTTSSLSDHQLTGNTQMKQQRASSSSTSSSASMPNLSSLPTASSSTVNRSQMPNSASLSPKKQKMSNKKVIDLESSDSDSNGDLFPRQPNTTMTGTFTTSFGEFQFKYHVIHSDRPEVAKYFPIILNCKGRARALEIEQCLKIAKQKPNLKVILFQMLPRDKPDGKLIFENFASHLVARDRYAVCEYAPNTYRAYILSFIKGSSKMKAFDILNLKPRGKHGAELYGLVIKKSALIATIPPHRIALPSTSSGTSTKAQATSSTATTREVNAIESSEFHNTNYKAKYGNEKFPQLDVHKLAHLIHSSVDDLISLTAQVSNLLQKTTDKANDRTKADATAEFQSKMIFIMGLQEQQHAKRKKAYETILSWLKTIR